MKLSQIYANKSFKTIQFNDGLNLILAKVTKKKDLKKDSHNLGKTTLITVIDFLLLKSLDKSNIFDQHKKIFKDYVFYLEIKLNSGKYLTIKRSIDKPTKISIKKHLVKYQNFIFEQNWDYHDIPLKNAKQYLNKELSFDVIPNWDFRKSVTYFLRSQNDYRDVFQLNKFSKGKDVDWKPFLFDLLGFDGRLVQEKYDIEQSKAREENFINSFKSQLSINPDEIDKIRGAIELKKIEKDTLESQINNFNFYQQEIDLKKELIEDIEAQIAELNTKDYELGYEIDKINESFNSNIESSIDDIKQIYEEVNIVFPEKIIKNYEQLLEFNKLITEERNKYLLERLNIVSQLQKEVRKTLKELDSKRSTILSVIKDRDSFRKYNKYRNELLTTESEIVRLEEKLKSINKIDQINDIIKTYDKKIEDIVKEIKSQLINPNNLIYPKIRKVFSEIIKFILDTPAIIFLIVNDYGNIEFKAEIQSNNESDITAEGKGFTYKKFLCMAFDLSILISFSENSFFKFVYHDGALEGLDNRKKINFINFIKEACAKYNIQYIFTSIEDDLPRNELDKFISFNESEIALILDDSGEKGKLFEFSF